MHIPIIFSFARSGGTLVNQLLGAHPDCMILSEVNPAGSVISVAKQASQWLELLKEEEAEQFKELPYSEQIVMLNERAKVKNKTLIIRDWVTANYLSGAGGQSVTPSYNLEQFTYLVRSGYSLQPLVVTRKAYQVYCSIKRSFSQLANLSEEDFLTSYLAYAHAVNAFPKVSLERLQSAPQETLRSILNSQTLSTGYIDRQLESFADYHKCTGNNTLTKPVATSHLRKIVPVVSDSLADNNSANKAAFAKADRLLGYEA